MNKIAKYRNNISKILLLCLSFTLVSCGNSGDSDDSIYILYTNDVHGMFGDTSTEKDEDYVTYSGLKEYKNKLVSKGCNVLTVDCGDSWAGSSLAYASKGELTFEGMN